MENVLYRKTLVPMREAKDGETPTVLYCTSETNAYIVWVESYDGTELVKWFSLFKRDEALEFAIAEAARRLMKQSKEKVA